MLSRFAIFVFVASLICVALASPAGSRFHKRANPSVATATIATASATSSATPTPKPSESASNIYPDYSGITSKSTDPLNDGWKGMDKQNKGKTFCIAKQLKQIEPNSSFDDV